MIYHDDGALRIRTMAEGDIAPFVAAFKSQGWGGKGEELFRHYLAQQEEGVRSLLTAELDGEAAGYVTLCKQAEDGPFRGKDIPEIKDFNVLQKFQRRGIGARLMDAVEALAAKSRPVDDDLNLYLVKELG